MVSQPKEECLLLGVHGIVKYCLQVWIVLYVPLPFMSLGRRNPWGSVYNKEKSCGKVDLLIFAVHLGLDVGSTQRAVMV